MVAAAPACTACKRPEGCVRMSSRYVSHFQPALIGILEISKSGFTGATCLQFVPHGDQGPWTSQANTQRWNRRRREQRKLRASMVGGRSRRREERSTVFRVVLLCVPPQRIVSFSPPFRRFKKNEYIAWFYVNFRSRFRSPIFDRVFWN